MIRTLFREDQIQKRIEEIALEIQDYYQGKPLTVVVLLNGGIFLLLILSEKFNCPCSWILWQHPLTKTMYQAENWISVLN